MPRPEYTLDFVRRSNLIVPLTDGGGQAFLAPAKGAWDSHPDAVTLDLEDGVPESRKAEARAAVREAIPRAAAAASEVFLRVNPPFLHADLEAGIWEGVSGIVLPKVRTARDVAAAARGLREMEGRRGIREGALEIIVLLGSALGVWNVREIVSSDPRVTQVGLGETDFCADIGVWPSTSHDPLEFARGRMIIEATHAGVQPVGIARPLDLVATDPGRDEVFKLATDGRNMGFKGVLCRDSSWVEPVNAAMTPAPELVEYYAQVREVFAQAVAAGTAAVPFAGRMIDVPVDEWAKDVLRRSAACRARDDEKRRALEA
ncbi:MAG: hypothetical protein J4F43_01985 [Dehalococcoidia bacterium]|nr:hypothetical protein [Dehalococcoidia bacterium]